MVHVLLRFFLSVLLVGQKTSGSATARAVRRACLRGPDPEEKEALRPVDALRERLIQSEQEIKVEDHGAGTRGGEKPPTRTIGNIARRAATGEGWSRVLFKLARDLKPDAVFEMGTNLGIGAATLTSALQLNQSGRLTTIEGDPTLARMARDHLASMGFEEISEVIEGRFDRVLGNVCERCGPFDFVFVDGHHDERATVEYVHLLSGFLMPNAILVLDDVEPGRPVRHAWRTLQRDFPAWTSLYLGKFGVFCVAESET